MNSIVGGLVLVVAGLLVLFIAKRLLSLLRLRRPAPAPNGAQCASNLPHEALLDVAEDVAGASRIAATIAATAAYIAAPAGLAAVGVALGIISAPLIVRVAPILAIFAIGCAALSASAKLYAKWKRRKSGASI